MRSNLMWLCSFSGQSAEALEEKKSMYEVLSCREGLNIFAHLDYFWGAFPSERAPLVTLCKARAVTGHDLWPRISKSSLKFIIYCRICSSYVKIWYKHHLTVCPLPCLPTMCFGQPSWFLMSFWSRMATKKPPWDFHKKTTSPINGPLPPRDCPT